MNLRKLLSLCLIAALLGCASAAWAENAGTPWLCLNCNIENTTDFCPRCGAEKPQWVCACGRVNGGRFCSGCGQSLAGLTDRVNEALQAWENGEWAQAADIFARLKAFDSRTIAVQGETNLIAAEQEKETYYRWGEALYNQDAYPEAIERFKQAGSWRDAAERINACRYQQGVLAQLAGSYDEAAGFFQLAGAYADAAVQVKACYYMKAEEALAAEQLDEAAAAFAQADDYADATERALQVSYEKGVSLQKKGDWEAAAAAFAQANGYQDADTQRKRCFYLQAEALAASNQLEQAVEALDKAGDYADAADKKAQLIARRLENAYAQCESALRAGRYDEAAAAFAAMGDYRDAAARVKECYNQKGAALLEKQEYDAARAAFLQAGDWPGSAEMAVEALCRKARALYDAGKEGEALNLLRREQSLKGARALYLEMNYALGQKALAAQSYQTAIAYFQAAEDYPDARTQLHAARCAYTLHLIEETHYVAAYRQYLAAQDEGAPMEDYAVVSPGDTGERALAVLAMARDMEFLEALPKSETAYKEKYARAVKAMEKALGLEADGVIRLSEMAQLAGLLYPGQSEPEAKAVLEKLCDLGYIESLPEEHDVYKAKYKAAVKRAEKALGLQADGFLTEAERKTLLRQASPAPEPVKNLKFTSNEGTIKITWSAAKNAKWYEIYRDWELIATTQKTSYTDKDVQMGLSYAYEVRPCNYSRDYRSDAEVVYVEPVYTAVSVAKLSQKPDQYLSAFVRVSGLRRVSQSFSGNDLKLLCRYTADHHTYYVYLLLENYHDWDWEDGNGIASCNTVSSISGKGQVQEYTSYGSVRNVPVICLSRIDWEY